MPGELEDKVAIITGGASGLGKASVHLFAEEGAKIVIADLEEERGHQLADELGSRVAFKRTDVSSASDVEELVSYTAATFGGLDIMFNNAGIASSPVERFLDDDLADFARVMNVDLLGVMLGCKYAAPELIRRGGGSIINTASTGGSFFGFGVLTYRAAKAGVIAVTKSLAIDFGEYQIRVNSISPGPTKTEMVTMDSADSSMSQDMVEELAEASMKGMMKSQPLDRMGLAEDVAQGALFLASDRSRQVSGLDLKIDGAQTAGYPHNTLAMINKEMAQVLGHE